MKEICKLPLDANFSSDAKTDFPELLGRKAASLRFLPLQKEQPQLLNARSFSEAAVSDREITQKAPKSSDSPLLVIPQAFKATPFLLDTWKSWSAFSEPFVFPTIQKSFQLFNQSPLTQANTLEKEIESVKGSQVYESVIYMQPKTELKHFKALCDILIRLFEGQEIKFYEINLETQHMKIFKAMILTKATKKASRQLAELNTRLFENIPLFLCHNSHKRLEECFKFIMTKVIKKLKRKFFQKHDLHTTEEPRFYEHYFGKTARDMGLGIEEFRYPQLNPSGQHAFKREYFQRIFKSPEFRADYEEWANQSVWKEYKKTISKKFIKLFEGYERKIEENPAQTDQIMDEVLKDYTEPYKKKLPWTHYELMFAINKIRAAIN